MLVQRLQTTLGEFWKDARHGVRSLRRSPAFATVAVLSLALGIGANTAIFSVVNAVLLRPIPYRDPGRVVMLWDTFPARHKTHNVVSPADFLEWQRQSTSFQDMAAIDLAIANLTGVNDPEEVRGQFATASLFPLLGVRPALGRVYSAAEADSESQVVVLSHRLWERRFGADPAVLGKSLEFDRRPFTVIGVMPAGFEFLDPDAEYWRPQHLDPHRDYRRNGGRFLTVVARLKPGVSIAQAQGELNGIAARLERDYPAFHKGWGVNLVDLREEVAGDYRRPLTILQAAVCFVLLIACVNVANLLLSRSASRKRELAVRASLGAGPWRIARQLLVESCLLAAAGCAAGTLLAVWGVAALRSAAPASLPMLASARIDEGVLIFALLVSGLAAMLFGVLPAFLSARVAPLDALKDSGRSGGSTSRRRLGNALVMIEFALSVVLLVGSGLLMRSFANLLSVDTGFRPGHVLTARILLPGSYNNPRTIAFFREMTQRLESVHGVISASAVTFKPFGGIRPGTGFTIENRPQPGPGQMPVTDVRAVRPKYFQTMGIPLLRGRDFTDADGSTDHPLFIINQSMAARYWPDEDPIGRRITVDMGAHAAPGEIVGIVADTRDQKLEGQTGPTVFYPHPALPIGYMSVVVRTSGDPNALRGAIVQAAHSIDPQQPVVDIQSLDQMLERSVADRRFQMLLLAIFAGLAMGLAAVGIYGVISYSVAQRTNEIGIRMALGARRADVMRLVAAQGVAILAGGLILGLGGAVALTRTVSTLLYQVKPLDLPTFGGAVLLLAIVAAVATVAPARRASRVDPLVALRWE
jgi:putative ABC transport system permease protein